MTATFALAFLRIGMPGGGPCRIHNTFELPKDPSKITIFELKQLVLDWARKNCGPVIRVEIVTPLEAGDDDRTLENWVEVPTLYQMENSVKSENDFWRTDRGTYGKWAVNFYYNQSR